MAIDIPRWKWSKREALLQELDARVRIKDIKAVYDLKDAIAFKWYEPLLKIVVLVAGVGFAVTFFLYLDRAIDLYGALEAERNMHAVSAETLRLIFWFIAGAFALMLISGMVSLELLLTRVAALRRLQEIQLRVIEHLQAELEEHHGARDRPAETDSPDAEG